MNLRTKKAEYIAGYMLLSAYVLLGIVSLRVWKPHFEESFSQWKLIMGMCGTYTQNYHHFNDLFLLQALFEWLYGVNPATSWFPLSLWLVSYLASGGILYVLWKYGMQQKAPVWPTFVLSLASLGLLSVNWLWIHHNRTAFLVGLLGALVLVSKLNSNDKRPPLLWIAGSFILVCLSILFRAEAGIVVTLWLLPSVLFMGTPAKRYWVWRGLPALPVAFAVGYFLIQAENNPDFRWQLEPDVEHELMDRKNLLPSTEAVTLADSARQYALTQWMLGDVQKNNAAYIRSLINKPDTWIHRYLFFLFPSSRQAPVPTFQERLSGFAGAHAMFFALLCGLLLTAAGPLWYRKRMHMVLFAVAAMGLLAGSFTVNQYTRITQPLQAITFCWLLFLWIGTYGQSPVTPALWQRFVRTGVALLALLYTGTCLLSHTNTATAENRLEAQIENRLNTVMASQPQRKWVLTAANYTAYKTPALQPFTGFGNKTLLLPEIGQYSANPAFLATGAKLTGCPKTDFKCRMQYVDKHKSEIIFVSTEKRLKLYEQYMQAVYGVRLDWSTAPRIHLAGDTYFWLP